MVKGRVWCEAVHLLRDPEPQTSLSPIVPEVLQPPTSFTLTGIGTIKLDYWGQAALTRDFYLEPLVWLP